MTGHFIVLSEYKNGKIRVLDPNSQKRVIIILLMNFLIKSEIYGFIVGIVFDYSVFVL